MSLLAALFVQIARISESPAIALSDARSRKAAQIEQFRRLVDQRYREARSVENYAQDLGVSAGHLGRLCRDTLGMSPQDVINARVVHEAQRELVYSSLSVKQVAAVLGFQDEAYFGRFFRKHTGQRPTEFRQIARAHLAGS
jgi:AraC family transcriptional activator of pobA